MRHLLVGTLAACALVLSSSCIVVQTNSCLNGIRDGNETDVDCGGSCGACGDGARCLTRSDCASDACVSNVCTTVSAPACADGLKDGFETDIDCGGGQCGGCTNGRHCILAADCQSGVCTGAFCAANAPACVIPTQAASTASYPLFRVVAGGSAAIPAGDVGFTVTANGTGGYRVAWSDQSGGGNCMTGIIRGQGGFDTNQTNKLSGSETVTADANEVRFASTPGTRVDGVDMVTLGDPLYLDAYLNGSLSNVRIYYQDATAGLTTASSNPASFSP